MCNWKQFVHDRISRLKFWNFKTKYKDDANSNEKDSARLCLTQQSNLFEMLLIIVSWSKKKTMSCLITQKILSILCYEMLDSWFSLWMTRNIFSATFSNDRNQNFQLINNFDHVNVNYHIAHFDMSLSCFCRVSSFEKMLMLICLISDFNLFVIFVLSIWFEFWKRVANWWATLHRTKKRICSFREMIVFVDRTTKRDNHIRIRRNE